jgi:hypothetical protein
MPVSCPLPWVIWYSTYISGLGTREFKFIMSDDLVWTIENAPDGVMTDVGSSFTSGNTDQFSQESLSTAEPVLSTELNAS